jgi:glycerol-3-phosphate acyltransferase PlsY
MEIFLISIVSYIIGSIPFGFILTKIFLEQDIRKIGSGNIGATNALRTGNKTIGYSTLLLDILKAVITLIFLKIYYSEYLFISALCIFLGHVFPIWLKFKGGKGVATYVGILLCINPFLGLIFVCVWFLIFSLTKFSSLSSILSTLSIPLYIFIFLNNQNIIFFLIMFILIFFTHRENIKRLINKEESKTKIY